MDEAARPGPVAYVLFGCGMVVFLGFFGLIAAGMLADAHKAATTCWGFVDRGGQLVIAGPFDDARPFHEGLAAVAVDDRWGFVDRTGKLVIAHRLATVATADVIVVLDDGRVVERGSHEELVAGRGVYSQLHALLAEPRRAPQVVGDFERSV